MTSAREREICPELPIGEMPTPRVVSQIGEGDVVLRTVEMLSYDAYGECKQFRWFRNVESNIDDPQERKNMARRVARMQHFGEISIAYDPTVHFLFL